eukprot:4417290-Amphidinium_carterae.2
MMHSDWVNRWRELPCVGRNTSMVLLWKVTIDDSEKARGRATWLPRNLVEGECAYVNFLHLLCANHGDHVAQGRVCVALYKDNSGSQLTRFTLHRIACAACPVIDKRAWAVLPRHYTQ